jgi:hypothetical protein
MSVATLRIYHDGGKKTGADGKYDATEVFYFSERELPAEWKKATRYVLMAEVSEMHGVGGAYVDGHARGVHTGVNVQVQTPVPGGTAVCYDDLAKLFLFMLDERRAAGRKTQERGAAAGRRRTERVSAGASRQADYRPTGAVPTELRVTVAGGLDLRLKGGAEAAPVAHVDGTAIVTAVLPALVGPNNGSTVTVNGAAVHPAGSNGAGPTVAKHAIAAVAAARKPPEPSDVPPVAATPAPTTLISPATKPAPASGKATTATPTAPQKPGYTNGRKAYKPEHQRRRGTRAGAQPAGKTLRYTSQG